MALQGATNESASGNAGQLKLADANMSVTNDNPGAIDVEVSNNTAMAFTFGSRNILPYATVPGYVSASNVPWQSSFDIGFQGPNTPMHVCIGEGSFSTSVSPQYYDDGTVGAVLAPNNPFSTTGTDYSFLFFCGPGLPLRHLVNSILQANLPQIVNYVNKPNAVSIKVNDNVSLTISHLDLDPAALKCTYATITQPSDMLPTKYNINMFVHLDRGGMCGTATINEKTSDIKLSAQDVTVFVQVEVDASYPFVNKPQVKALQCSIGSYDIEGDIITTLEDLSPLVHLVIGDAYRTAGAINTTFNQATIKAINQAITNANFTSVQTGSVAAMRSIRPRGTQKHHMDASLSLPSPRLADIDYSNWMSTPAIQAKALGQLKIPGTHDSGTYLLESTLGQIVYPNIEFLWSLSGQSAPINDQWPIKIPPTPCQPLYLGRDMYDFTTGMGIIEVSQTQGWNLYDQLQAGIRYFDLRVYFDDRVGDFFVQHGFRGPQIDDLLSQIQKFMDNDPTSGELIFVVVSHTNFAHMSDLPATFAQRINHNIKSENLYYQQTPSGESQFDLQSLADLTLSTITNGAPKVMFLNPDTDYSYTDTVTNTAGFAGVPWKEELYTVDQLVADQGPRLQSHDEKLWGVGWVLGVDTPTIVSYVLDRLRQQVGTGNSALQDAALNANSALQGFLDEYGTNFQLLTVDWFDYPKQHNVASMIVGMNYS